MSDSRVAAGLREQLAAWRAELEGGARRVGWKIGFNVPAIRDQLGIEEPAIGYLTSATLLEDGATYSAAGATRLVAEPEVAIEVGDDGAIASYAPAIELADFNRPFDDLQAIIAEDIFHRAVILGPARQRLANPPRARVRVNDDERESAYAADGYFDYVLELTGRLLGLEGERLRGGDRIICGAITPPVPVGPGDAVTVDFGELGTLGVRITD